MLITKAISWHSTLNPTKLESSKLACFESVHGLIIFVFHPLLTLLVVNEILIICLPLNSKLIPMKPELNHLRLPLSTFCLWISMLILSSCEKKDTTPPTIEVITPTGMLTQEGGSSLHFNVVLRDNMNLAGMSVSIREEFTGEVVSTEYFSATGKEATLDDFTTAGGIYTPTGNYELIFQVEDASQNTAQQTMSIHINELPLQHRKLVLLTSGWGSLDLTLIDTSGVVQTLNGVCEAPAVLTTCGFAQAIIVGSKQSPAFLKSIDPFDLSTHFQYGINGIGTDDILTGISQENAGNYYCSTTQNPALQVIHFSGGQVFSAGDPLLTHPATSIENHGDDVWLGFDLNGLHQSGGIYRLNNFPLPNLVASTFMDWVPIQLERVGEDVVLAAGVDPGTGFATVEAFSLNGLDSLVRFNFNDDIIKMSVGMNYGWIITESEVFRFDPISLTLQNMNLPNLYSAIVADRSNGHIYLGTAFGIEEYTENGALVQVIPNVGSTPMYMGVLYNK
jgi:hypothetical protein